LGAGNSFKRLPVNPLPVKNQFLEMANKKSLLKENALCAKIPPGRPLMVPLVQTKEKPPFSNPWGLGKPFGGKFWVKN